MDAGKIGLMTVIGGIAVYTVNLEPSPIDPFQIGEDLSLPGVGKEARLLAKMGGQLYTANYWIVNQNIGV